MTRSSAMMTGSCPVCEAGESAFFRCVDGYDYLQCASCESLHIDRVTLGKIDAGESTRIYDESYWREELIAARERSRGESLVRAGEAILYARRPVQKFLDIGTGPGYLLDELTAQFSQHAAMFHGVELFPPEQHSEHANYHVGDVGALGQKFDAGVCIEMVEHLTPAMLTNLAAGLAKVSEPDALWLINTGMPELVLHHDPGYLDPLQRGHIVSYSLAGLRHLFEPHGFRLSSVPGKNYLCMAEYQPSDAEIDFERRVCEPLRENFTLLKEAGLLHQATLESALKSVNDEQLSSRTQWVESLRVELERASRLHVDLQAEHQNVAEWAHSIDVELGRSREQYAALRVEHQSVTEWAHSLDIELRVLREKYVALQAERDLITRSRSWTLTRPLRSLASWWRSARHRSNRSGAGRT